jgi:hypothetical protein
MLGRALVPSDARASEKQVLATADDRASTSERHLMGGQAG